MKMWTGFNLYRNDIGTGLGKLWNVFFGLDDHQVNIQGFRRHWTQCLNNQGANRDVGDETTVHHINVNPVSTRLIHGPNVVPQL
jgi:hypothetical protein